MIIVENDCQGNRTGGFFSKFLVVLDWIHNSIYTKESVVIDWSCLDSNKRNIWELFFDQPNMVETLPEKITKLFHYRFYHYRHIYEQLGSIMGENEFNFKYTNSSKIFSHPNFNNIRKEFNKAWNLINLKDIVTQGLEEYSEVDSSILGVAVRPPLHYTYDDGVLLLSKISPQQYYEDISNQIVEKFKSENFKKIFVASDIQYFIDLMIQKVGEENLIYTKYDRIKHINDDWFSKNLPVEIEYGLILKDTLLLSRCGHIMGGSSNIFLGTLYINPELNFTIFNVIKDAYGG
jgi:hypothetical protein